MVVVGHQLPPFQLIALVSGQSSGQILDNKDGSSEGKTIFVLSSDHTSNKRSAMHL